MSKDVTYDGETSRVGAIEAFFEVGGRVTLTKDGSRWEEYDSRA